MTDDLEESIDTAAAGCLLTRLPGRARPRTLAFKEFEESVEELKLRYKRVFWPLFIPKAENLYRWRMQLECGCVRELFTRGTNDFPDQHCDTYLSSGNQLPAGEYRCHEHEVAKPYREIVEWGERDVEEFAAAPEEPQYGLDPEVWAVVRNAEPHSSASWSVQLSCGHSGTVLTVLDFAPGDEPRRVTVERRDQMRHNLEEFWATEGPEAYPKEGPGREHMRHMLDLRMPKPEPEQECWPCSYAKKVTGYQRIGWLVPRSTIKAQKRSVREKTEAQLVRAEAEVERLRRKLNDEK